MIAALTAGSMFAAARSSSTMADAAVKLLGSLTPEQRQQAAFAFEADERMHWHFIPTEMFPRKGLLIRTMTEPQRKLAHDLMKAGLSQRGYLTASSIMDLETVLEGARGGAARGRAAAAARHAARARSGEVLLLGLRHAVGEGHLGLARRRPSRLAALHRRQRHAGRGVAVVLRQQSRRSARGAEEGAADSRRGRGRGARAAAVARRGAAHEGDHRRRRRPATW